MPRLLCALAEIRPDPYGLAVTGDGFLELAFFLERISQVRVRAAEIRVPAEWLPGNR